MNLSSFRLRIALSSAALAGTTLVGFGAVSWFQIYNAKISRLDAELLNNLMRATPNLPRRGEPPEIQEKESRPSRWQFYEDSLSDAFGTNTKTPIALLVLDASGKIIYQSSFLSTDVEVNRLLLKRLQLIPLPPPPQRELPPPSNRNVAPPPFLRPRPTDICH
jgi:two-component system heavy metal sensor histidine kinase CusS